MIERLAPVPTESIPLATAAGRVVAQDIETDRPSPPSSVSAMDGYAIRAIDANLGTLPVTGEAKIGKRPPTHAERTATRIYTGSPVPPGADTVVKREDVREQSDDSADRIEINPGVSVTPGQHIRIRGENAPPGTTVLHVGDLITPPAIGALATFGVARVETFRTVRVHVLVTGDELADADEPIDEFTIRDSNGPATCATINALPWATVSGHDRVADVEGELESQVRASLDSSDAIILTGGVSMGRYDFVPAVLEKLNCQTVFHKLPQRPGRPMLGAIGPAGQTILALPGNPVSVLCTLHRLAVPILRHLAGFAGPAHHAEVALDAEPDKSIPLWWYRPVRLTADGGASLVANMGSGDIASIAASDGFIEMPPNAQSPGLWPFWRWRA